MPTADMTRFLKKKHIAASLGAACLLATLLLLKTCSSAPAPGEGRLNSSREGAETSAPDNTASDARGSKRGTRKSETTEVRRYGDLQRELMADFNLKEANRAKILSKTKHGAETWYLLGVDAPSAAEVKEVRAKIAEAQKQVADADRRKLEGWLDYMVGIYDPLGSEGMKGMLVKIPDDPKQPVHGVTFSTTDFNADIERFDPKNGESHTFENYRGYHRDDHKLPERFENLFEPPELEEK